LDQTDVAQFAQTLVPELLAPLLLALEDIPSLISEANAVLLAFLTTLAAQPLAQPPQLSAPLALN
jgi:hypothetical protein